MVQKLPRHGSSFEITLRSSSGSGREIPRSILQERPRAGCSTALGPRSLLTKHNGNRHAMTRYVMQRILGMLAVMFTVVTIVFIIVRIAPGDPAAVMLGPDATAADIAGLRARLGLDQSLPTQYVLFLGQLCAAISASRSSSSHARDLDALAAAGRADLLPHAVLDPDRELRSPCRSASSRPYKRGTLFDQLAATLRPWSPQSVPSFWLGHSSSSRSSPCGGAGSRPPATAAPTPPSSSGCRHLVLPAAGARHRHLGADHPASPAPPMLDVAGRRLCPHRPRQGRGQMRRVVLKHALKNLALIPVIDRDRHSPSAHAGRRRGGEPRPSSACRASAISSSRPCRAATIPSSRARSSSSPPSMCSINFLDRHALHPRGRPQGAAY